VGATGSTQRLGGQQQQHQQQETSSSGGRDPLFAGWNIARWVLGSGGRPPGPPPALPPQASAQVAATAAAQAAAALAVWEEAEENIQELSYPGEQRRLGGGGFAAGGCAVAGYEDEEEEQYYDAYRPFKLLLAGGACVHVRQGCAGVSGQPSRKRHSEGRVHCAPPVCMCRFQQQQRTPRPHVHPSCPRPAGVAGAVSRSATAPIDRLKMLLQIHDCEKGMTIKEGIRKMSAEGAARPGLVLLLVPGCNCVDAGLVLGWVGQLLRRPWHLPCCPRAVLAAPPCLDRQPL
jgi:hypothetical protein